MAWPVVSFAWSVLWSVVSAGGGQRFAFLLVGGRILFSKMVHGHCLNQYMVSGWCINGCRSMASRSSMVSHWASSPNQAMKNCLPGQIKKSEIKMTHLYCISLSELMTFIRTLTSPIMRGLLQKWLSTLNGTMKSCITEKSNTIH